MVWTHNISEAFLYMLSHVKCEIANIQWFFLLTEMESNTNVGMEGNIKKIQS